MKFLNDIIYSYVTLYADTSPLFHTQPDEGDALTPSMKRSRLPKTAAPYAVSFEPAFFFHFRPIFCRMALPYLI